MNCATCKGPISGTYYTDVPGEESPMCGKCHAVWTAHKAQEDDRVGYVSALATQIDGMLHGLPMGEVLTALGAVVSSSLAELAVITDTDPAAAVEAFAKSLDPDAFMDAVRSSLAGSSDDGAASTQDAESQGEADTPTTDADDLPN